MEQAATWVVGLSLLLAGVLLVVVGRKQQAGTLRRNGLVGLRTTETLRSDAAWYAAHGATAGLVGAAGVVQLVCGAAVLVVQSTDEGLFAALVLGGTAVTLALVLSACIRGHRIARHVNEGGPDDLPRDGA